VREVEDMVDTDGADDDDEIDDDEADIEEFEDEVEDEVDDKDEAIGSALAAAMSPPPSTTAEKCAKAWRRASEIKRSNAALSMLAFTAVSTAWSAVLEW
jgi:hypothetical protein